MIRPAALRAALLVPLGVAACTTSILAPSPELASIDPPAVSAFTLMPARLLGRGLGNGAQLQLDDRSPAQITTGWRVIVGQVEAADVQSSSDGELRLTLPPLPAGLYEVTAVSPSGARANLPSGLLVGELDLAVGPDLGALDLPPNPDLPPSSDLPLEQDLPLDVDLLVSSDLSASPDLLPNPDLRPVPDLRTPDLLPPPLHFAAPVSYGTDATPYDVATFDIDRDGKLDLLIAHQGANTMRSLIGRGDGTFAAGRTFAAGQPGQNLSIGDFDRDGIIDAALFENGHIEVFRGDGKGGLGALSRLSLPNLWQGATADFDGDSRLDLVSCGVDGQLSVALGRGDGTFANSLKYAGPGKEVYYCVPADIDGDRRIDVVTGNFPDSLASVSRGLGAGALGVARPLAAGMAFSVGVADLDRDGDQDVFSPTLDGASMWVLLNRGNGTFDPPIDNRMTQCSWADEPVAADLDGDGVLDLAVACKTSDRVVMLHGNGAGRFTQNLAVVVPSWPLRLEAGDFNGDGQADLAVVSQNGNNVSILLNRTR